MGLLSQLPHAALDTVIVDHHNQQMQPISKQTLMQEVAELIIDFKALDMSVVAFVMDNTPAWLIVDFALIELQQVSIPLPTFFSPQQLTNSVNKSGVSHFISDTHCELDGLECVATLNVLSRYPLYIYKVSASSPTTFFTDTQKVTFTSGSTGEPKGVCLSLQSQLQVATSLHKKIAVKQPKHLCLLPLPVLLENIAGVFAPLLAAGEVHVMTLPELGFSGTKLNDASQLINAIDRVQPNTLILVPELLTCLVWFAKQGWTVPKSLKFIAVGGAVLSSELITEARSLGLPVYQGYGLSEASSVVSLNTPNDDDIECAGRVLNHLQSKLVDGQLFIKGPLFLGYLGQQPHDQTSWYATGDLVEQQQGRLTIKGRLKNQIITSFGRNISAEWPESLLLSHSEVQQAVVFGEGKAHLVALIYASVNMIDSVLAEHCRGVNAQLPEYAQIKTFHRLAEPLNTERGLLTSNNRPKRQAIANYYHAQLTALYSEAIL